ncbi:hypothetical protein J41TS12_22020 [Paenibacillus antibioticophila]|uniref:DUF2500 domain-containing protein n=1 Tax=Paenibacillus antibioticophila TaxID=1274374 RepID=A0A919XQF0_9BACL|nr:DUF2500 domain-containing protein [Paenibacillus antibioticophila]GIO37341.1 hypothetical protein J41TS12_22020 [Paenibacillus antibioticophila]
MQSWVEMFDIMNSAFPIFIVVLIGILAITTVSGIHRHVSNSRKPMLSVHSLIVGKRTEVSHRHDPELSVNRTDSKYFVTFEVESGDRLEFIVSGEEYGQCSEGDEGKLTFQGTRYLGFERMRRAYRTTGMQEYRHY